MSTTYLHQQLIDACQNADIDGARAAIEAGADVNFNLRAPMNALSSALESESEEIVKVLLHNGAIVKEFVLQKAIERDTKYLDILIEDFSNCKEPRLLMSVLQAAITIGDFDLAQQAIRQGADVKSLYIYAVRHISNTQILELLLENGFNLHAENNMMLSEWMGSSKIAGGESWTSTNDELLAFVLEYYLKNPHLMEKFYSLRVPDKKRLFLIGLYSNNLTMMKFAIMIGADKTEALNTAHRQYHSYKSGNVGSIYSTLYKKNKEGVVDYAIIEYLLASNIKFNQMTIARAVCFEFHDILNAIREKEDLEYAYEMAYQYENDALCQYFRDKGVSIEAQNRAKMRVSALKGDIKELQNAIKNGADVKSLDRERVIEIIQKNQVETLKLLCNSGLQIERSIKSCFHDAVHQHKAYDTISYLIEEGHDISSIRTIPQEYKKRYPAFADMQEKRIHNIFEYTLHLVKEVYPESEGRQKEKTLQRIAELSALPYVKKMSEEQSYE